MKKEKIDLFPSHLPEIEKIIGYTFRDKSLITQAFTRTSFCNENGGAYQSNEVLEFIGDSVLSVSIITFLMDMHAERYEHGIRTVLDEGDFSNIKSKLSDKKNLSDCITSLGLEKYLRMGEGDKKLGIEKEPSVKEDLFESIIGATYIDCGRNIATVMKVVSRMLDVSIYAVKNPPVQSAKNALQEFCADKKRKLPPPVYKTLSEEGPDHKKVYERGVYIGDRLVAGGKGKNMKLADAAAADAALKVLLSEEAKAAAKAEPTKAPETKKPTAKAPTNEAKNPTASPEAKTNEADGKKKVKKKPEKLLKPTASTEGNAGENANGGKKQTKVVNSAPAATTVKTPATTAKKTENATRVGTSAAVSLKSMATKSGVATPTFKDLGEVKNGGKTVCRVECIFMGKSAVGEGATRPEAKENAASHILAMVSPAPKSAGKGGKAHKGAPRRKKK
ncbi:MAG: hypothetical protein IKV43_02205 [Clostridia bacterium]|nr:hypothetical protein [Clostridia bacterium]